MKKIILLLLLLSFTGSAWAFSGKPIDDANCKMAWLMDADTDPLPDASGDSKTGVHSNDPIYIATAVFGGGFQMNETDDYFTSPTGVISGATDITHGCWIRTAQTGDNRHIMNIGVPTTNLMSFFLLQSDGAIKYGYWGSSTETATTGLNDDAWHHIVIYYDKDAGSSNYICYVDGTADANQIGYSSLNITDAGEVIGAYTGDPTNSTYNYVGDLDEVFIFDKSLTATEINQIMDMGLDWETGVTDYTADADCLMALLMEIDEDPLTDSSGEGNTGALKAAGEPNYATASPPDTYSTGYYIFDGADDDVDCGSFLASEANFTAVSWVFHDDLNDDDYILSELDSGFDGFFMVRDNVGSVSGRTDIYKCGVNEDGTSSTVFVETAQNSSPVTTWTHTAMTFVGASATGLHVYVDGVEDANSPGDTTDIAVMNSPVSSVFIGAQRGTAEFFDGNIDEPAIFTRTLTFTEINDIMDNGLKYTAPSTGRGQVIMIW